MKVTNFSRFICYMWSTSAFLFENSKDKTLCQKMPCWRQQQLKKVMVWKQILVSFCASARVEIAFYLSIFLRCLKIAWSYIYFFFNSMLLLSWSQNHRISCVGSNSQGSSSPTTDPGKDYPKNVPVNIVQMLLEHCQAGSVTTSLRSLFQWPTTLWMKQLFVIS